MNNDNNIKSSFAISVNFSDDVIESREFGSADLESFFQLIEQASEKNSEMFFELQLEGSELLLQVSCQNSSFCIFQDPYDSKIYIHGSKLDSEVRPEFIQVWNNRWPLTYFLPLASFINYEEFKKSVAEILVLGRLETYFEFSQRFSDLGLPEGYC